MFRRLPSSAVRPRWRTRGSGRSSCSGRSCRPSGLDRADVAAMYSSMVGMRPSTRADRRQFGRAEVDVGVLAQAVGEVAGRGRDDRRALADLRLVAHAQRAAGHLHARAGRAEHGVVAFLGELLRRPSWSAARPTAGSGCRDLPSSSFAGGAEVADVGHARADEHLVDLGAGHLGQRLHVVRVVRAGEDRLVDRRPGRSRSPRRTRRRRRAASSCGLGEPGLHRLRCGAASVRAILVAVGDHPLHQRDVGL